MTETLLSVDEARAHVLASIDPVGDEVVSLVSAGSRILSETIESKRDLPGFDNSAMDGIGVKILDVTNASSSSPVKLMLAGTSLPGGPALAALTAGHAVRVMTGAPIPPGVEAVIMREQCDERDVASGFMHVLEAAKRGQHIRKRGEDVSAGDVVGRAGDVVTPARLNLLLSSGHVSARVHRRPVIGVLASGDELKEVGAPLGDVDVVNSNAHAVAAAAAGIGCDVHVLGIARDTLDDHVRHLEQAKFCDAIITIGGVSMGTHDFTRPALEKVGAVVDVWKVAMRPGKPVAFAQRGSQRIFGLPGNPVSALVSFELFVRPALRKLAGASSIQRPLWPAILVDSELNKKPGLEQWARGSARVVDGKLLVRVLEGQGSHQVSVLARANALVRLTRDTTSKKAGDVVDVLLLEDPLTAPEMQ